MKRRNVQLGFVGEGIAENTDIEQLTEGDEAIDIEIQGGKLMVTLPAGVPDEEIFEQAGIIGGELILETGQRFSFEIQVEGAIGVTYTTTDKAQEDDHTGLSSLPDVPGGA